LTDSRPTPSIPGGDPTDVATELNQPDSLVFDTVSGSLLVAEQLEVGKIRLKDEEDEEPDPIEESLDKTKDPIQIYMREMGATPLLTREEEGEIAKRIEKGQGTVIKALCRSPVVVTEMLKYRERLKTNDLDIKNLVEFHEGELTDEILEKRRKRVLRRLHQIGALEAEAAKARKRLHKAKTGSKEYKRLLSQLARYRIPIARSI